ncbi:outer membrane autotransporter protein [Ereboglobus sp. PH5-5]|uniref:autotransporter outer membrane beta-barrel domain-containing protein n=1 Tax=Ereboglobus sp. PH5-5 TaxID=2940529 RepID=UPI002404D111|nr:autotransporter outer membrane beta-barrel domain-containing protein [Ereboglobus sp. PH5-5]MDF9834346.1 outer membrane autotransporter protein [Ereboglobus sp. PH5-5]
MRQTSHRFVRFAAFARATFAAVAGLAFFSGAVPAFAADTVIWTPPSGTDASWAWDDSAENWTSASTGSSAKFADGDSVVFGVDADGTVTGTGYHVVISSSGVTTGASGTNPGMIIASGSWHFSGGAINDGSFLITGSSELTLASNSVSGGQRDFLDQRFEVADNVDFAFRTEDNTVVTFSGSTSGTLAGGAFHTGSDSNLTFGVSGTYGGMYFLTNTTSAQGGAIATGGDFNAIVPASGSNNWINLVFIYNNAGQQGGAIYSEGNVSLGDVTGTNIRFTGTFHGNQSGAEGGAIFALKDADIKGSMTFVSNTSAASGGVIYAGGDVSLDGAMTFADNVSGSNGGVIYAGGDVTMSGSVTITGNTSGTDSLGGAIYTKGNLVMSGSESTISIYRNTISGSNAPQTSSAAYVGGTVTLSDYSTLVVDGGIVAQSFIVESSTIAISANYGTGTLALTTIDSNGDVDGGAGKIRFDDATLAAYYGSITATPGSDVEITGTLTVNATGTGAPAAMGTATELNVDLVGSGELRKTGAGMLALTGSNTYTGPTTIDAGTLIGNITDSSTLNIIGTGVYRSGTVDRTIASLNGIGTMDMQGCDLTLFSGDFTGTIRNTANVYKTSSDMATLGTGTVGNIHIEEGSLAIGGNNQLKVTGTLVVAADTTLNLSITDTIALDVGELSTTTSSTINIAGYGNISSYDRESTHTLVVSGTTIDRDYALVVNNVSLDTVDESKFLVFTDISTSGTDYETQIVLKSSLVWESTANQSAHGTFYVDSGTFTLATSLEDNDTSTAWFNGWDGKTLTKTGTGTLVLAGTNNSYTGWTIAEEGLLVSDVSSVIGGGTAGSLGVYVKPSGTMLHTGTLYGDVVNENVFIFENTTSEDEDEEDESTRPARPEIKGNILTSGTFIFNTAVDYVFSGSLAGSGGVLVKTGTAEVTIDGGSSYSGTVQINQGALISGRANNFDSIGAFEINADGVLDLGGYNQNIKNVMNHGVLRTGSSFPESGYIPSSVHITNFSGTITGTTGTIFVRSDYNSGKADKLILSGTLEGEYVVKAINIDKVTPDKTRKSLVIIELDEGNYTISNTLTFSGTTEVGMGRLMVRQGVGGLLTPENPNVWYLAATDELSNLGDAVLSTASVAGLEWHYQLDSVRQRMGDLRQESLMTPPETRQSPLAYTTVTSKGGNMWLRANAYNLEADISVATDPFDETVAGIASGYDKTFRWEDNQYLLGAYAVISNVDRDFDIRGDGETNSIGLGFYFSYLKDNGWYGDTTLLIMRNSNKIHARALDGQQTSAEYNNAAWGISQEVGKIIRFKNSGWWVEPSAQLSIAIINGKTYNTVPHHSQIGNADPMEVKIADANIKQARAAIRTGYDRPGSKFKPYIRLAAASASTKGGRIRAGSPGYPQYYTADLDGTRYEAGIGCSWVINRKSQLYLDYEYAKAQDYKRPWAINFGYRSTW